MSDVASVIRAEARRRYGNSAQRAKFERAAYAIGIVESGLRELDHGDADSKNWRQERESVYGPAWAETGGPLNTRASVNRVFDEMERFDRPGQSYAELAAEVQRPAAQYRGRYGQHKDRVEALMRGEPASKLDGSSGAHTDTQRGSVGAIDPVTLYGQGGAESASDEIAAVMSFLKGDSDVLQMAAGVKQARELGPQDVTLPGTPGTPREPDRGGGDPSPSQPNLQGGLRELGDEALRIARKMGYSGHSGQRTDQENARVGGAEDSDHLMRDGRIAYDIPMRGEDTLRSVGMRIAKRYGIREIKPGFWEGEVSTNGGRHRVQVIAGAANDHGDHVHVGLRRVG